MHVPQVNWSSHPALFYFTCSRRLNKQSILTTYLEPRSRENLHVDMNQMYEQKH